MLHPQHVGVGAALRHHVRVLDVGLELAFGRHELRAHAGGGGLPARAAVARGPHPAARHAHLHVTGIARIDQHRVNAGMIGAAAEPLLAPRIVPQRPVERPRLAAVIGTEQPARQGAAPDHAGLVRAAGRERPDQLQRPLGRRAFHRRLRRVAFGLVGILRRRHLVPRGAAVRRSLQLDAEVAVVQRGEQVAVPRVVHRQRDVVTEKTGAGDVPPVGAALEREQALARGDMAARAHEQTILRTTTARCRSPRRRPADRSGAGGLRSDGR